jgi:hypothetical protein
MNRDIINEIASYAIDQDILHRTGGNKEDLVEYQLYKLFGERLIRTITSSIVEQSQLCHIE